MSDEFASDSLGRAIADRDYLDRKFLNVYESAMKFDGEIYFGEKYGETVRVVEMGGFSMEFCGGTHLDNTAKAGPFRIKSESSVASGVRRMEATCGRLSLESMEKSHSVLSKAAQFLKTAPAGLLERMEQQAGEMKQLRQAVDKFKAEASLGEAKQFLAAAKTVKGLHVLTATREGLDANALRKMGDFLRDKDPAVVGVLASISGEKITFLAVCGKDAVKAGVKAGPIKIRVFRPFPAEELAAALAHVKAVAVMDKSEGFSGTGGPVYAETAAACYDLENRPKLINVVYGLGGRDCTVSHVENVFNHLFRIIETGQVGGRYLHMGQRSTEKEVL